MLSNHDQLMIPCIKLRNHVELEDRLEAVLFKDTIKTIFIDEGQFYSDLVPCIEIFKVWNKMSMCMVLIATSGDNTLALC